MKKFGVKEVVATAILAALVFVLLRFVAIPTPLPNTTLSVHNAVIAFFSLLFGPIVGFVGGFIGNMMVDVTAGWGIWWSWIFPTGIYGLIIGIACKDIDLESGVFGKKEIIKLNIVQVIAAAICWGFLAPIGDVVFYGEPAGKVFAQGAAVGLATVFATAIIGSLLCKAYASTKAKNNSLSKED